MLSFCITFMTMCRNFRNQQVEEFGDTPSGIGIIPANTRLQIGIATDIENKTSVSFFNVKIME